MSKKIYESTTLIIIILSLFIFASYLSFTSGYGSDEDTLPMIYVFESKLITGKFVSSRFTGNPVAEIGIGFLAYFFGSGITNFVTFTLFFVGLIIFYNCFYVKKNFLIFLLLSLSSPILFFDNLEPVDYSWAFFFFSIGLFFFKKNLTELAIIFFALSVGVRINFFIFIIFSVLFFHNDKIDILKRIVLIFCIFFVGSLFYLPVWYDSKFQLYWLTAGRPTDEGFFGLIARFFYKSFYAFGGVAIIIIIYQIIKNNKIFTDKKNYLFLSVIFSNLLLFFWIPAELSYLQPALIFLYFLISQKFDQKILLLLIGLNFLTWVVNPQFLNIKYSSENICDPKHAIGAEFTFYNDVGYLQKFIDSRRLINCWAQGQSVRSKRIRQGLSIKE